MTVYCPGCGKHNKDSARFCSSCGEEITGITPSGTLSTSVILDKRYEIVKLIKTGGMGGVYLAKDQRLDEPCAVKEMYLHTATPEDHPYIIEKFKQEAKILAKLRHPNLPVVSDYFVHQGRYYLIMDYIEGEDLDTLLAKHGTPGLKEDAVMEWSLQMADVLSYLHSQNPPIIYRDLKPSNIMLRTCDSQIMLVDFGIARLLQQDEKSTQTKIGTPHYSAPEQFKGFTEPRSDLYSLGATMHHLLTGAVSTPCKFSPVRSIVPGLSESIEKFLLKALQDKIENRFPSAIHMKEALLECRKVKEKVLLPAVKEEVTTRPLEENKTPVRVAAYVKSLSVKGKVAPPEKDFGKCDDKYWEKNLQFPGKSFVQEMVLVPAGEFWLGEDNSVWGKVLPGFLKNKKQKELDCPENVRPKQKLYLNAFYIDRYPVTNLEYKHFEETSGYKSAGQWKKSFTDGKEQMPVVNITWYDAQEYARWSGKRLPSEEEWEKAARGPDGKIWPWGNEWEVNKHNCEESRRGSTTPAGYFPGGASHYGVFDMTGNVWEWTASGYMPYPGNKCFKDSYSPQIKVIRGGAWNQPSSMCRTFIRRGQSPENWFVDIGFRCVKST